MKIPSVVHIHSGRFDDFCRGFSGSSGKANLNKNNRGVIILEERWKSLLKDWLPEEVRVIRNFAPRPADRSDHALGSKIKLLLLSRNSRTKGLDFAVDVLRSLGEAGVDAELTITGEGYTPKNKHGLEKNLIIRGWVDQREKEALIETSDFLLSPSGFEGASMSIIESMVSGLPCIVSPASSETVGDIDLVVEDLCPVAWAARIIELHHEENYNDVVNRVVRASKIYQADGNIQLLGEFYNQLVS